LAVSPYFFIRFYAYQRYVSSFPTRRSSDLSNGEFGVAHFLAEFIQAFDQPVVCGAGGLSLCLKLIIEILIDDGIYDLGSHLRIQIGRAHVDGVGAAVVIRAEVGKKVLDDLS